ncbi:MAG TPA: TonB family protein [Blastocatellia bacterium]|nr:TonB family protein [Blastocatellia bacterium]
MSKSLSHTNSPSVTVPTPQLAAPEPDEWVRAALGKRFDIVSRIAEHDTHFVYSARDLGDPDATRLIRLKVLRTNLAGESRQVELFRLEAAAAARLSHKNILKATEAQETSGVHFAVSEERPGVITLRDHLERRGWLELEEAAQVSQQVADALQHAHSRGVLHLTLDPDKVLLDESGTVYVAGFGIDRSKDLLWARQERSRHCAARYVAPEQILSGEVDQRTDLYLLGLVLFEMITDRAPFESEDEAELRTRHLARTPAPPHAFRQEISRELSQVVLDLLSKRSDGRPFYVSAFKAALSRCLAAGLIHREPDEVDEGAEESAEEESVSLESSTLESGSLSEPAPLVALEAEQSYETDAGRAEEFQEPEIGFDEGFQTDRDVIEIPLETAPEYERVEALATRPLFATEEPARGGHRRFVWMLMLLLLVGVLFWAVRGGGSKGKPKAAPSGEVANLQASDDRSASNVEPVTPAAAESRPEEKPAPDSALANLVTGVAPTDVASSDVDEKASPVTEEKAKPDNKVEKVETEVSSPPKRAEIAPPVASKVAPVVGAKNDLPARPKELTQNSAHEREPAPAPPRAADPPAPRVIRKSGDVLQNTAVMRPRPIYPKEASKVKGAVTVEVTIDEDGSVIAARPISGPEPLRAAALAAARRWKWVPERVDQNRARVVGTITLNFKD